MTVATTKNIYRRQIPFFVISFITTIMIVEYFWNIPPLTSGVNEFVQWGVIISTFTMVMANAYLISRNAISLSRGIERRSGREIYRSCIFLGVYILFIAIGVSDPKLTGSEVFSLTYMSTSAAITLVVFGIGTIMRAWVVLIKLGSIRNLEMLTLYTFCVLGLFTYITPLYTYFPSIVIMKSWLDVVLNAAVQRSVVAAAGVGTLVLALRSIVGKEPGFMELEVEAK